MTRDVRGQAIAKTVPPGAANLRAVDARDGGRGSGSAERRPLRYVTKCHTEAWGGVRVIVVDEQ